MCFLTSGMCLGSFRFWKIHIWLDWFNFPLFAMAFLTSFFALVSLLQSKILSSVFVVSVSIFWSVGASVVVASILSSAYEFLVPVLMNESCFSVVFNIYARSREARLMHSVGADACVVLLSVRTRRLCSFSFGHVPVWSLFRRIVRGLGRCLFWSVST